jgi:folate-binding protein YgfZ
VGSDALEMYRIARGVPRYGIDLRERDLAQETGQEHALSFIKGCYIGQEIVERVRARGNVHRTFIGFEVQGEPPQPGTKVRANDKDVGEITSASRCRFPAATGRWLSAICGEKLRRPARRCKLASRAPR